MQKIFYFIKKQKMLFLYLFLLGVSFYLTQRQYSYHSSFVITFSGNTLGVLSNAASSWTKYFYLKKINEELSEENAKLKNLLAIKEKEFGYWKAQKSRSEIEKDYAVLPATIVKNSFKKANNYIILDKGENQGVKADMGVITRNSVLGVIVQSTPDYSVVKSVLNSQSHVPARFKKNDYFGSIVWDGKNRNILKLVDIPRQAPISKGDTIVIDKRSTIFPADLLIGTVNSYNLSRAQDYYEIDVLVHDDFASQSSVYIVNKNNNKGLDSLIVKYDE